MPRSFEDYFRERQAIVALWLAEDPRAPGVIEICQLWVTALAESGREVRTREDFRALPAELDLFSQLTQSGFDQYAKALKWGLDTREGIPPSELPLVCHALAVASGRSYALYGPDRLKWLASFIAMIDNSAMEAFSSSATEIFKSNPDTLEALLGFVQTVVERANESPDQVTCFPPRSGSMALMVAEFARNGKFQDVWDADQSAVFFRWSFEFEFVRRAAPERFIQFLDELPHPAIADECLSFPALIGDPEEIIRLLSFAKPAFDDVGAWKSRRFAAILLLKMTTLQLLPSRHLQLDDLTDDPATLEENIAHYKKRAEDLVAVVVSRPDGLSLGLHWLDHILRMPVRQRASREAGSSKRYMISHGTILAEALSHKLSLPPDYESWVGAVDPVFRNYRATAVLCAAALGHVTSTNVGNVALELLKRNDLKLINATELLNAPASLLRLLPGVALTRIAEVDCWYAKAWSSLRPEREQSWRHIYGQGKVDADPAQIMAIWGLGTLEILAQAEPQTALTKEMWWAVESAFREASLTEPNLGDRFWSQALSRLFSYWPSVFLPAERTDKTDLYGTSKAPDPLSETLFPYVGVSGEFIGIIVSLHLAGVEPVTLSNAVSMLEFNLLHLIRRFRETTRRLTDVRVWNPAWVATLQRIETALTSIQQAGPLAPTVNLPARPAG